MRHTRPARPLKLLIFLLAVATGAVRADIYAFTDDRGVTHFTNVPADPRYAMLLKAAVEVKQTQAGERLSPSMLARSAGFDAYIAAAAESSAVHPDLLRAVIVVESGFNANAVSRRGAQGLMQLMPATARHYGVHDSFDPAQNIAGGARYLRTLLDRYDNDLHLVLAAYNAGERAVENAGRRIPPFKETRAYVPRVLKVFRTLSTTS